MRILCLTYEYPPVGGGGARVALGLAEALAARGHELEVVTSGMPELPPEEVRAGVRIHRVPCMRRHLHYTTTAELLTLLRPMYRKARELHAARPFELNHTHFVLPTGLISWWLWRRAGLPYAITAHGSDIPGYNPDRFQWEHRVLGPLWRQVLRKSRALTAGSEFLRGLIQRQIALPVEIVPNGHDLGLQATRPREQRVLVVTRMFERKGVQHLLQALPAHGWGWEYAIVGDGPYLPELRRLAERLRSPVQFSGFLEGQALRDLYETSRVFVFPSIAENFPMVLLEAMSAGLAVVTTDAPGCAGVVGHAGLTVPCANPVELRKALEPLLGDDAAIEQLSARARERVKDFTWPRIAAQCEALFTRCARAR